MRRSSEVNETKTMILLFGLNFAFLNFRSLSARLIVLTVATTLGTVALIVPLSYQMAVTYKERELGNRLRAIAATAAPFIDGQHVAQLTSSEAAYTEAFTLVRESLHIVQQQNQLDPELIYTLSPHADGDMIFGAMLHETPFTGDRYQRREAMNHSLNDGIAIATEIYHDKHGHWISAYAPINDKNGDIVGILEVDYRANQVYEEAKILCEQAAALVAMILALSAIVTVGGTSRMIRPLRDLAKLKGHRDFRQNLAKLVQKQGQSGHELNEIATILFNREALLRRQLQSSLKVLSNSANSLFDHSSNLGELSGALVSSIEFNENINNQVKSITEALEHSSQRCLNQGELWSRSISESESQLQFTKQLAEELESRAVPLLRSVEQIRQRYAAVKGLMSTIRIINRRTRILALNSAIEAQRQSANGDSFRVIAQEIRGLSEQVEEMTRNLAGELSEIAATNDKNVRQLNQLQEKIVKIQENQENSLLVIEKQIRNGTEIFAELNSVNSGLTEIISVVNTMTHSSSSSNAIANEIVNLSQALTGQATDFELLITDIGVQHDTTSFELKTLQKTKAL